MVELLLNYLVRESYTPKPIEGSAFSYLPLDVTTGLPFMSMVISYCSQTVDSYGANHLQQGNLSHGGTFAS